MDGQPLPSGSVTAQTNVTRSQGVYVGDNGIQINLFSSEQPSGPVVVGNVPHAPPAFQPRDDLMAQLRMGGPTGHVVRVVTGMRGVGKSQLAAAYARECIDAGWRLVAWVSAEDSAAMLAGLAVVADRLGITRPGTALEAIASEVRNRLEADGDSTLVVFDNVTDPDTVRVYLPSAGQAHVVVTSTQASVAVLGKPVPVGVFTEKESVDFLGERSGLQDVEGAAAVARELGGLPLALAQAAAVLQSQHMSYRTYLDRLRSYPTANYLPAAKGEGYPRGTAEAILMSIDAVTATDKTGAARDVLAVISLLAPQPVPPSLLRWAGRIRVRVPAGSRKSLFRRSRALHITASEQEIDEILSRLAEASLVTFTSGDVGAFAHRLVARVVRERCARDGILNALGQRASTVIGHLAMALDESWEKPEAVRETVQYVIILLVNLAGFLGEEDRELYEVLLSLCAWALRSLQALGDSTVTAVQLGEMLLSEAERVYGPSDPFTLRARNNLGLVYRAAGRPADALVQFEQALADGVRVLGEGDQDVMTFRGNLASLYGELDRTDEAVAISERTLADRERLHGADHLDTLLARNNLGQAYLEAGRTSDAIPLLERSVEDYTRVRGAAHPDTRTASSNLAMAYLDTGRVDEAVPLLEEALAANRELLPTDHPVVLSSENNLALAYYKAGRPLESLALYADAVENAMRVLGGEHPDTQLYARNMSALIEEFRAAGVLDDQDDQPAEDDEAV